MVCSFYFSELIFFNYFYGKINRVLTLAYGLQSTKKSHERKISYSSYSDGWGVAILPFLGWVIEGTHHYLKPKNGSVGQYILPSTSISWVHRWWKLHSCRFAVNTIWALTKSSPATALGYNYLSLVCVPPWSVNSMRTRAVTIFFTAFSHQAAQAWFKVHSE